MAPTAEMDRELQARELERQAASLRSGGSVNGEPVELGEPRIVLGAIVLFQSPQEGETRAIRGETVQLTPVEEERLDKLGMLAPAGATMAQAEALDEQRTDVYRGRRGDQEAFQRALDRSRALQPPPETEGPGIVNLAGPDEIQVIADYIRDEAATVPQTVALAEGDPVKAAKVLEAESLATGGSPRQGVAAQLAKVIG